MSTNPVPPDPALDVVIGAGPVGTSVAEELIARGRRVRVVTRSGKVDLAPHALMEVTPGDAVDPEAVRRLAAGAQTVYLAAQPRYDKWPEQFPPIVAGTLDGLTGSGATLVFADNLYMYGPVAGPLVETLPYAATGRKGRIRAQLASAILEAHAAGRVRAAIGRAADFFGPRVRESAVGERVFDALLAGKPADLIGDPDAPHTYTYIGDFARGLVTLGSRPESPGRAWHVPSAPTLTTRQFVTLVAQEAGVALQVRVAPRLLLTIVGAFNPVVREVKEMLYEFDSPFVMDHSAFERAFPGAVVPTPHADAVRATLAWYRGQREPGATARPA